MKFNQLSACACVFLVLASISAFPNLKNPLNLSKRTLENDGKTNEKAIEIDRERIYDFDQKQYPADVVIEVGKFEILANQDILKKKAPFFTSFLSERWAIPETKNEKFLKITFPEFEIEKETMMLILTYIYSDSAEKITDLQVPLVYSAADFLRMPDLIKICENRLNVENALEFFKAAFQVGKTNYFPKLCLFVLGEKILTISDAEKMMLRAEEVNQIIFTNTGIISSAKLWNFLESYGKVVIKEKSTTYQDSTDAILDVLERGNELSFRFNADEHSKILKNLLDATNEEETINLITPIFNKYLSKKPEDPVSSNPFSIFSHESVQLYFMEYLSQIITTTDLNFSGKSIRLETLFKTSAHGFSPENFHKVCDDQGPTITLVKLEVRGKELLLAAYNYKSWPNIKSSKTPIHFATSKNEFGFIAHIDKNLATKVTFLKEDEKDKFVAASSYLYGPYFMVGNQAAFAIGYDKNSDVLSPELKWNSNDEFISPFSNEEDPHRVIDFEVFSIVPV